MNLLLSSVPAQRKVNTAAPNYDGINEILSILTLKKGSKHYAEYPIGTHKTLELVYFT